MLQTLSFSLGREAGKSSFPRRGVPLSPNAASQLRSIVGETVQTNGECVFSALEGRSGRMYGQVVMTKGEFLS
jgi:hypothetical protein